MSGCWKVESVELDRKTCIGKGGVLETTQVRIRQICLAIRELCHFDFQFPYRDRKVYFKELLRRIIDNKIVFIKHVVGVMIAPYILILCNISS